MRSKISSKVSRAGQSQFLTFPLTPIEYKNGKVLQVGTRRALSRYWGLGSSHTTFLTGSTACAPTARSERRFKRPFELPILRR